MLVGIEEIARLVEDISFEPEVFKEAGAVSVWLPEFRVYGRGKDLAAARLDLLDEVRDYVREYLEEMDSYRARPESESPFPSHHQGIGGRSVGSPGPRNFCRRADQSG